MSGKSKVVSRKSRVGMLSYFRRERISSLFSNGYNNMITIIIRYIHTHDNSVPIIERLLSNRTLPTARPVLALWPTSVTINKCSFIYIYTYTHLTRNLISDPWLHLVRAKNSSKRYACHLKSFYILHDVAVVIQNFCYYIRSLKFRN